MYVYTYTDSYTTVPSFFGIITHNRDTMNTY